MSVDKQIFPFPVVDDIDDQIWDERCCQQKVTDKITAGCSCGRITCDLIDE